MIKSIYSNFVTIYLAKFLINTNSGFTLLINSFCEGYNGFLFGSTDTIGYLESLYEEKQIFFHFVWITLNLEEYS